MGPKINDCVNCSYTPSSGSNNNKGAILHEISEPNNVTNDSCVKIIKVETVLNSIYKLNYLKDLKNVADSRDPLSFLPPQKDDEEFGVCENCSSALIDLWRAYTTFNQLSHLDSSLNNKISTLDDLIQTLSNESDPFVNVKSEIDEDSGENSDENSMDNDDDSHLLQCKFQEEVFKNQNFTNDDDDTTSQFTSTPRLLRKPNLSKNITPSLITSEPSVSIRRLKDDEITAATKRKRKATLKKTTYKYDDDDSDFNGSNTEENSEDDEDCKPGFIVSSPTKLSSSVQQIRDLIYKKSPKPKKRKKVDPGEASSYSKFNGKLRIEAYPIPDGKCPLCQVVFNIPSNLTKHFITHIEDKTKHVCPLPNCAHNFGCRESLLCHLKNHTNDVRHSCPAPGCSRTFTKRSKKTNHLKAHYKENIFICQHCNEIFDQQFNLENHLSTTHPQLHFCPACPDKVFEMELHLKDHIVKDHPNERLYLCTICLSSYKFDRRLKEHMRSHEIKNYICSLGCGKKFTDEKSVKVHEDGNCKGPQNFQCPVCSRTFKDHRYYEVHLESHKGQSQIKCTWEGCDKTFYHKMVFKAHFRSHSTERTFTCDTCGQSFKTRRVLNNHSAVHGAPKTHLCSCCGKAFLREEGLRKHMKVHSDKKGYTCEVCHKEFKYSESKRLHFLTQHQEAQFICTICNQGFPYNFSLQKHMSTAH